jgi:regulator of replication initiation timing
MSNDLLHEIERLNKVVEDLQSERDELLAECAEAVEVHSRIMAEKCPSDEYHCTCVPALREELAALKADWKVYRDACAKQDDEIGELKQYNVAILDQNGRLSNENDRLRGVLKEIAEAFDTGQTWSEIVFTIRYTVRAELNI